MLVSVLLPAFNAAPTFAETLATVFAQDWPDWELIVVDDNSADETLALARNAAARHPGRVRALANPRNLGAGPTRNRALAASRGALVASLDADDLWEPDKLRRQVEALVAHPGAAMVWGPGWYSDAAGAPTRLQPIPLPDAPALLPTPLLAELMLGGVAPFTSGVMVRRAAALAVGGYEPLRRGQDMSFLFKLALAFPAIYDPRPHCRYRLHPASSTSRSQRSRTIAQRDDAFYHWLAGFLGGHPAGAHLAPAAWRMVERNRPLVAAELTAAPPSVPTA